MTSADARNIATDHRGMDRALERGGGVLRLAPRWVPRAFCTPGRRLRLHSDDYFPFPQGRGGIDERWLASTVRADNGPDTGEFEGLSLVVEPETSALLPFDQFVDHHGADAIGERLWSAHRGWPMYSKFFDNQQALPFHLHHTDEKAALVGKPGKPEAYYYPPQMNNHLGDQPVSFLGLIPEAGREAVAERLRRFAAGGDNGITNLARGYRTRLGTGWDIPSGVLHAPASVCTYEPQVACDVFCMCESWSNNREVDEALLWKDVPTDRIGDFDFVLDLIDWGLNADPYFVSNRQLIPFETARSAAEGGGAFVEKWIVYRSPRFSATELTVRPGRSVMIHDAAAYGTICIQGQGVFGAHSIQAAEVLRYGELSQDEFFVTEAAARAGVTITNLSAASDLVLLKHFGPQHPDLPALPSARTE